MLFDLQGAIPVKVIGIEQRVFFQSVSIVGVEVPSPYFGDPELPQFPYCTIGMDRADTAHVGHIELGEWRAQCARYAATDQFQTGMKLRVNMSDKPGRIQLLQRLDPFTMNCSIQKRRIPHRSRHSGSFAHDPAQGLVAYASQFNFAGSVDVVVQSLQDETVQIHEITWNVHAGNEALVTLNRAEDVGLDEDSASVGTISFDEQTRAVFVLLDGLHELFDVGQVIEAEVLSQSPGEKIACKRKAANLHLSNLPSHEAD